MPTLGIERIAYHEAGHAVAAHRLNLYVGDVSIVPSDGRLGVSESEGENVECEQSISEQIIVLYAGAAAERILEPACELCGCESDDEKAAELHVADLGEQVMRDKADQLLREHWAEVEAVATALLEDKQLTGDEASLIMDCVEVGLLWRMKLAEYREFMRPMSED